MPPNELLAFARNSDPPDSTIAPIGTGWSTESKVGLVGVVVAAVLALLVLVWFARRRRAATTGGSDVA